MFTVNSIYRKKSLRRLFSKSRKTFKVRIRVKRKRPELIGIILDAGTLLNDLEDIPQTEIIKGYVADFIVKNLFIIESFSKSSLDIQQQRMYAYYKALIEHSKKRP